MPAIYCLLITLIACVWIGGLERELDRLEDEFDEARKRYEEALRRQR